MDLPFAFGVTSYVANFPYDLPQELKEFYGGTGAISRHAQKWLEKYSFQRSLNELKNQNQENQR